MSSSGQNVFVPNLPKDTPPEIVQAFQMVFNALNDLNQAINSLKQQLGGTSASKTTTKV